MKSNIRILSALLAAALMLSLTACSGEPAPTGTTQAPTETTQPPTLPTYTEVENPVQYFSVSMGETYDEMRRIDVYANEDGSAHVEYVGREKKVGNFEANVFHGVAAALDASGLMLLNGQDAYEEGEASASMYVEFADGSMAMVTYGGKIPTAFAKGYEIMDNFFLELTASLPVYVPQPVIVGEVEEALLSTVLEILNNSGNEYLDGFTVSPADEGGYSLGLSSTDGITNAVTCAPMMMTTAYSLVIVALEEGKDAQAVCDDFEGNLDWRKWVCVAPSNALIAQKDNMVLCLMAAGDLYAGTAAGIEQAGWTTVKALKNPDMN